MPSLKIREPIIYDETLNGTPDYLVATKSELGMTVIGTPLIMLVEAIRHLCGICPTKPV